MFEKTIMAVWLRALFKNERVGEEEEVYEEK